MYVTSAMPEATQKETYTNGQGVWVLTPVLPQISCVPNDGHNTSLGLFPSLQIENARVDHSSVDAHSVNL